MKRSNNRFSTGVIERRRLRWYGHVKRMDERKYGKQFLEFRAEGMKIIGCQKRKWNNGIIKGVKKSWKGFKNIEEKRH